MKKNNSIQQVSSRNISFLRFLLPLLAILLSVNGMMAQQVIGSFPTMDGGFEGQASSGAITSTSYATGAQSTVWTTSSSGMGTFQTSSPRTGGKYVNVNYTSTTKRLQSPTAAAGAIVSGTNNYTVQYYYRTSGSTAPGGGTNGAGASTDGTNPLPNMSYTTITPTGTSGVWTKMSTSVSGISSTNPSPKYGYLCPYRTATAMAAALDIDDVVMYEGGLDVTAPDPVTIPNQVSAAATQQTISWTAPNAGVDGGGYMVVRGLADPTTTPNANGIYAVGNFVAGTEKVVYLGTNTSFVDLGLTASTTYYYRIYTVDKAFNYSTSATLTGATGAPSYASEPTNQASGISFANVTSTSMDINWNAGNGTNSLVVVRAGSAVNADPADGDSYAPNTVYGSGTQIGTGNYAVYNGTGSTVTITGLGKATTYNVKVYSFNGSAGSENYLLTSPASGSQLATPGEIVSKGNGGAVSYSTGSAWVGEVAPTRYDNVTIKSGDIFNVGSTQACYNLTIESGGKLVAGSEQKFQAYGTNLTCNGTLGDVSNTASLLYLEFGGNLNINGSGSIYPWKLRPITGLTNIGVTFDANVSLTMTGTTMIFDNVGNDNIYYIVNSPRTLSIASNFNTCSSSATQSTSNNTLTINNGATVNVGGVFSTNELAGKTYTAYINGTLAVTGSSTLSGTSGGGVATINVNGTYSTSNLNVTPSAAIVAPVINVGSTGTITVNGTADFSSTTLSGFIGNTPLTTGGTFNLGSTGSISVASPNGLEPITGPIRTTTRNFNTGANYGYVGTAAQVLGSDFPATVNNLTLNNAAGLSLGTNTTVNGILTLTTGALNLGNNNLTLGAAGTISGGSATAYVATTGTGKLIQPVAAATAKLFPIGTASSYDPVNVTPTDATTFSANVGTSLTGLASSGYNYTAKEWNLTSSAPSSTLISLTPLAVTATGVYPNIGQYDGVNYLNSVATLTGNSYEATFTSFGKLVTGYGDLSTEINPATIDGILFNGKTIFNQAKVNLQIFDAVGKLIISTNQDVNMSSKANGIYIVKSEYGTQKISLKK